MLKFKQPTRTQSRQSTLSKSTSKMDLKPCLASVVVKNISLPLAWPAAEFFDHKGDFREFNVCLSFKAVGIGKVLRSKVYQRINRTLTEIKFDETFTFHDLDPRFSIEAMISAKRTDSRTNGGTIASVSRSLGKKLGGALKKYNQQHSQGNYTISVYNLGDEVFKNAVDQLIPVARCFFRFENAGLSGKIRAYSLVLVSAETIDVNFNKNDLLPLFGTICCQVLCRPICLTKTLANSVLDIFYVDEELLLKQLNCVLENGCIKCYTKDDDFTPGLILPIDERTSVEPTAYQTAIRLTLLDETRTHSRIFMLIFQNTVEMNDWVLALSQQIHDAEAWGDFASVSTNPFALRAVNDATTTNGIGSLASKKGRTMTNTDEIEEQLRNEVLHIKKERKSIRNMFRDDENEEIRQFAAKTVPFQVEKKSEKITKPKEELKTEKPQKNEKIVETSEVKTQPSKTRKMDDEQPKSQVLKPKDSETKKIEAPKVPKLDLDEKKVEKIVNKPIEKLKRELPKEKSSKPSRSQTDNFEKRAKLPGTSKEIKKTPSTVEPVVSVPIPKLEKANTLKEHPNERIKLGFVNMNGFENGNLDKDLNQNDLRGRKTASTALKPQAKETKASEQFQEPRKLAYKVEASTKPPLPKSTPPKITSPKTPKNTYITKIIVGLDSDDDDIIVSKPKTSPKQLPTTLVENKMPNNVGGTSHVKDLRKAFERKEENPLPKRVPAPLTKAIFQTENAISKNYDTLITRL